MFLECFEYFICSLHKKLRHTGEIHKGGMALEIDAVPNVSDEAKRLLAKLRLPVHMKGYCYLCTVVELAVCRMTSIGVKARVLYSEAARIHGTTEACVERDIRYCIEEAWRTADSETLHNLFGIRGPDRRPTNMEFIYGAANMIILKRTAKQC